MKKNIKHLAVLPLMVLGFSVVSCTTLEGTGAESYKTYGEQVEDKKIVDMIRAKFRNNPTIPHQLIHLSIDRGTVQLSGFVRTNQEVDLAILSAKSTPGVKDVIDNIIVLSDKEYAKRRGIAEAGSTKR